MTGTTAAGISLVPVGFVRGGRAELVEDGWGAEEARIELDPAVLEPAATDGLAEFSHVEVVFAFHLSTRTRRGAEHPRGNDAWPRVGVLAHRGPHRPNHLGVTRARLLGVRGLVLHVGGLDAVDGTPVLDVKPYVPQFDPRGPVRVPRWSDDLMAGYF